MDFLIMNTISLFWIGVTVVVVIVTLIAFTYIAWVYSVRAHRHRVMTGNEDMIGKTAVATTDIGPEGGRIFIGGESWRAFSESPIAKGDRVVIKSLDNLDCLVEKAEPLLPAASSRGPESN